MKVRRAIFVIVGIALLVTLITPVAVSADTEDTFGTHAKKMLKEAPKVDTGEDGLSSESISSEEHPYNLVRQFVDDKGRELDEIIVPGVPSEERISEETVSGIEIKQADAALSDVPAFDWCYGCSATSAAMTFGYYDRTGYSNMYAGPTNSGVCPLDNSDWGYEECPLSATRKGYDDLTVEGHVDDYWYAYGSTVDPYYGYWTEHGYADCTADFMGTNQYNKWNNSDGSTTFYYYSDGSPLEDYTGCEPYGKRDGCHGIRLFVESRSYNVVQNYNQYIHEHVAGGFTYANFKAEIDAGRPVIIHVEKHSMLGYGYDDDPDTIYIHDTWDHNDHSMPWGGTYSGLEHYGVTVIQLQPQPQQSVLTSCDASGNEMNQFVPNQSVYVKGSGLEPDTGYNIWIQNDPVNEGETLTTTEDPSGSQEAVTTSPAGSFPATGIWAIPQSEPVTHFPYDIVVDKVGAGAGTYNSADDGIDSAAVVGFVAPVPELPTLILFAIGLLVLVGYIQLRRKKSEKELS